MLRSLLRSGGGVFSKQTYLFQSVALYASTTLTPEEPRPPLLPVFSSFRRRFASSADTERSEGDTTRRQREGADLLRSLNAFSFREHLRDLSESRMHIKFDELMALARKQGAAATVAESRALCEALVEAGVVFRYRDVVYLSTEDVAEIILKSLPDTEDEFEKRVQQIESELRPLEVEKALVDDQATLMSTVILWSGLIVLVAVFGIFIRLTYWELSWDVMEPIGYFFSFGYAIAVYCYFLLSKENFEYPVFRDRLRKYFRKNYQVSFDHQKYEKLTHELRRYQKYLARIRA